MSVDGIWQVEMAGLYGWEPVATAFLHNGNYWSGSENSHSVGNYEVSGNQIEISVVAVQHGKVRTVFGKKTRKMDIKLKGKIKNDKIEGQASDEDGVYQITFRATHLENLP